jgi:hypothetical protein
MMLQPSMPSISTSQAPLSEPETQEASSSDYKPYFCSSDDPLKPPNEAKKTLKTEKAGLKVPMKRARPSKKNSATTNQPGPLDNLPSVHCAYFSAFAPANLDPMDLIAASQNLIPKLCAYCTNTHL